MTVLEALKLVRTKYLEETQENKTAETTKKYTKACKEYPALMTIIHHIWAKELSREWPEQNLSPSVDK